MRITSNRRPSVSSLLNKMTPHGIIIHVEAILKQESIISHVTNKPVHVAHVKVRLYKPMCGELIESWPSWVLHSHIGWITTYNQVLLISPETTPTPPTRVMIEHVQYNPTPDGVGQFQCIVKSVSSRDYNADYYTLENPNNQI